MFNSGWQGFQHVLLFTKSATKVTAVTLVVPYQCARLVYPGSRRARTDRHTHTQTDGRTDTTKYIISLASRSINIVWHVLPVNLHNQTDRTNFLPRLFIRWDRSEAVRISSQYRIQALLLFVSIMFGIVFCKLVVAALALGWWRCWGLLRLRSQLWVWEGWVTCYFYFPAYLKRLWFWVL